MELRAHTQAEWYGAPPKMFCAPKSKTPFPDDVNQTTYFDYVNKGGSCKNYDPIKSGGWDFCGGKGCAGSPAPIFGHPEGRTDVEGCCWWGRGVIQTTGVCNFGKLNYFMGKRGK